MANYVRIELNLKRLNELMKSDEIAGALEKAADAVAKKASHDSGRNYERGRTRKINWIAVVNVKPGDRHAKNSELQHNNLLKAIRAVGLPTRKGGDA